MFSWKSVFCTHTTPDKYTQECVALVTKEWKAEGPMEKGAPPQASARCSTRS